MITCKFGGSCTVQERAIKNIKKIKKNSNERKIFVFSAIGKSDDSDTKVTDLLIELSHKNENYQKTKNQIIKKFEKLCQITKSKIDPKAEFEKYEKIFLKTNDQNFLISRGEFLTTKIMAQYLKIKFIPAENVLFFEKNQINEQKTQKKLNFLLKKHKKIAICGFYGINEENKITLFSRGGGDVSGAYFAKFSKSNVYENWTDVNGIFQVNPKYFESNTISKMCYHDLKNISSHDGKVVHQDCADILKNTNITLCVRNIFSPSAKKTLISDNFKSSCSYVTCKQNGENFEILTKHQNGDIEIFFAKPNYLLPLLKSQYEKIKD